MKVIGDFIRGFIMRCTYCGKEILEGGRFCDSCGKPAAVGEIQHSQPKKSMDQDFSHNIVLGKDGRYRWTYGMSMWKNPTILITLWKVFFIGGMFPVLLVTILELFEQGVVDAVSVFVPMFLGMIGVVTAFVVVAYPIVALMSGGSYQVVFELNDKGVHHIQMQKQFKKNQVIAIITALAGAAAGSPQTIGAGLMAGSKESSYSKFENVKKIVGKPSRHVIYVNESLNHNQVYVAKEDFDQVKAYIVKHCKKVTTADQ